MNKPPSASSETSRPVRPSMRFFNIIYNYPVFKFSLVKRFDSISRGTLRGGCGLLSLRESSQAVKLILALSRKRYTRKAFRRWRQAVRRLTAPKQMFGSGIFIIYYFFH
jgi:hypothetical protein